MGWNWYMSSRYRLKCCECGKFCSFEADSSVRFGNTNDFEPPEPDFYCPKCARRLEDQFVEQGWLPCNWIPAKWEHRAAKRLGWVRVSPPHASWSVWRSPDNIPEEWGEVEFKEI